MARGGLLRGTVDTEAFVFDWENVHSVLLTNVVIDYDLTAKHHLVHITTGLLSGTSGYKGATESNKRT